MIQDPLTTRERGTRRVRLVTAWVTAGTVAGTGAVAFAVAAPDRATAGEQTVVPGSTADVPSSTADVPGSTVGDSGRDDDTGTGGLTPPTTLPRHAAGRGHASSGGS